MGHFLLARGKKRLEAEIGYRRSWAERLRRPILGAPVAFYLGGVALLVAALCAGAAHVLAQSVANAWAGAVLIALFAIPASDLALALLNTLIIFVLPPRLLPKLAFDEGIPDEHRTLVSCPACWRAAPGSRNCSRTWRCARWPTPTATCSSLSSPTTSTSASQDGENDAKLLELAKDGIAELNRRHGAHERYFLLHRRRAPNAAEGRFMGWERKRGKLEELNRLLRGATDTTFVVVTATAELPGQHQVRDHARRRHRAAARCRQAPGRRHGPSAKPAGGGRQAAAGRARARHHSAARRHLAEQLASFALCAHFRGRARHRSVHDRRLGRVSRFVQRRFVRRQGHLRRRRISGRAAGQGAGNRLLSHDLFEGSFARSALATDIEVLDEQPATYEVVAGRAHRWLRGDWQLLPWLLPSVPCAARGRRPNDLRVLDRWKLIDNLRRSLVPPALVVLLGFSFFSGGGLAGWALGLVAAVFVGPILVRQVLSLSRAAVSPSPRLGPLGGELVQSLQQAGLSVMLLLDQALLSVDGILRTAFRLLISHRNLLEWTTMSQAVRRHRSGGLRASRRLASSAWLALLLLVAVAWFAAPELAVRSAAVAALGLGAGQHWLARSARSRGGARRTAYR